MYLYLNDLEKLNAKAKASKYRVYIIKWHVHRSFMAHGVLNRSVDSVDFKEISYHLPVSGCILNTCFI